jgi:two-component system LytT family sensor kinase
MLSRARLSLAIAWLLFWAMLVTTALQDYFRGGGQHAWQPVLWETSSAFTATLLMLVQRRYTRRFDDWLATPARWFGMQALWLPVYWVVFVPIAFGIRHSVYAMMGATYEHADWPHLFLYEDIKISVFFSLFALITFGVLSFMRAEQANSLLRTAQLQQLTQQMQPHFLFNALNTISSLMHTDVERADATLIQLSDVLRVTLDISGQQQTPLATELRLLRAYAHLMQERFDGRVAIAWHVDDSLQQCQVPVLSMQPLLENVFKHTVEKRRGVTNITVSVLRHGSQLVLRIDDDAGVLAGPELVAAARRTQPGGVGLRNVRERLAVLYGDAASLTLSQLAPSGVRAELRLPCGS